MNKERGKKKNRPNSRRREVIFEIRQSLRHAPTGFILEPKNLENRQFGLKMPHMWLHCKECPTSKVHEVIKRVERERETCTK